MIMANSISWFLNLFRSKWGRWYPLRNLVVGWLSHSLQDRDKSEIAVHVAAEVLLFCGLLAALGPGNLLGSLGLAFLLAHTLMFVIDGQLHSYLQDSIEWMKNAGVEAAVSYLATVGRVYAASDSAYAVLVYGSFCRKEFHRRSDLDIRVIRRPSEWIKAAGR